MRHPNRNGRRAIRQREAAERQAEYDRLPHGDKIARAEAAPGESKRQLARLRGDKG
jgi:hypothetical protein